ncbi:MAG: hypothetical protein ACFBSD_06480 [Paracoccaceae bacterium]
MALVVFLVPGILSLEGLFDNRQATPRERVLAVAPPATEAQVAASPDAGTEAALAARDAERDAPSPPPSAARFSIRADEILGYTEGRGLDHLVHGLLGGTHCQMDASGRVVWSRERPGGAACRVVLFRRGRLAEGWEVAGITLRTGHAASAEPDRPDNRPVEETDGSEMGRIDLAASRLPISFRAVGTVPLAGAQFWISIDRVELVGPVAADDWRLAFESAVAP